MSTNDPRGPWFQTAGGRVFHPHQPTPDEVFLHDIARALSMQCRFNGHCESFYSVAEHSVLVSLVVAPDEELAVLAKTYTAIGKKAYVETIHQGLFGLLHDAAEAYVGDMVSPIKHHPSLATFRNLEELILRSIYVRFELPAGGPIYDTQQAIRTADRRMLLTEKRDLRTAPRHGAPPWREEEEGLAPYPDMKLRGVSPARAEELFLARFHDLWTRKTGGRGWDDIAQESIAPPAAPPTDESEGGPA